VAWAHRGTSHTEPQTQSWRTLIKATRYPSGIGCGATRPTRASVGAVHDPSATHRCATHHEHRVAVARAAKIIKRSALSRMETTWRFGPQKRLAETLAQPQGLGLTAGTHLGSSADRHDEPRSEGQTFGTHLVLTRRRREMLELSTSGR